MAEPLGGKLYITSPDEAERVYSIQGALVRIGRVPLPQNDLALEHAWVSRAHARIYCDRLPYRIQDMRSSNGTTVNNLPLPPDEVRPLKDGDVIAIGPFRLRFEAPPEPVEVPSVATEQPSGAPAPVEPPPVEGDLPAIALRTARRAEVPAPPSAPPPETALGTPLLERWVGMSGDISRWLQYLPPIYSEDAFLGRYLLIFEDLLGPVEQLIAHFDLLLDPATAPVGFLPILNDWLGEIVDERWSPEIQRELLKAASELFQARGTRAGLERYLRIVCQDCEPEIQENADGPHTFRVILHAQGGPVERRMVERIIEANRPAHTSYTIEIV
jgi:phage tail-like protein